MLIFAMLVVLLLVAFPTTALGRRLRELLVDWPARRLASITPGKIAFYLALGMAGVVLFWLFEAEGVRLFSLMAPDLVVWFTVFDVSVFLDVMILGIMLSATARVRMTVTPVARRVQRFWSGVMARMSGRARARGRKIRSHVASDDPEPTGYAFAMA